MLTRLRQRLRSEAGATAIELLVVMLLMGIVGSVATTSLVRGMKLSGSTQQRLDALADLQKSVDRMTTQIRAAAPALVGGPTVQLATSDTLRIMVFRNDFATQELITYKHCSGSQRIYVLREAFTTTPQTISCAAPNAPALITRVVNNPAIAAEHVFSYATGPTGQIRDITVKVRRRLPDGTDTIEVVTKVRLRNVAR